jgi:hypothetical protein
MKGVHRKEIKERERERERSQEDYLTRSKFS